MFASACQQMLQTGDACPSDELSGHAVSMAQTLPCMRQCFVGVPLRRSLETTASALVHAYHHACTTHRRALCAQRNHCKRTRAGLHATICERARLVSIAQLPTSFAVLPAPCDALACLLTSKFVLLALRRNLNNRPMPSRAKDEH